MQIHIVADRKLSTTLYRKPTDCAALLHFHFNHSVKSKQSIVFSQVLRYSLLIADHTIQKKENLITFSISPFQKMPFGNHHSQNLQSSPPLSWHPSPQNPQSIDFQNCPSSCDPMLTGRKTILQLSTRQLAFYWKKDHNCTASGSPPPTPSIPPSHPTIKQNTLRTS